MNEQLLNANAANLTIADINSEMARIADLARAYANATPEQRANVDTNAMQAQLNRYNRLKAQRQVLYAEQEARVQAELEAQRQAAQVNPYRINRRQVVVQPEPVIQEQVPIQQPRMNYNQFRINQILAQDRARNVANVLSNQNLQPNGTIISNNGAYPGSSNVVNGYVNPTPGASIGGYNTGSAVAQRNAMPWYKQLVTPYSDEYLREIGVL